MRCGKIIPKAKNGTRRGKCSHQKGHSGRHGGSHTCFSCGIPLTMQNAKPTIVLKGCGNCNQCHYIRWRKPWMARNPEKTKAAHLRNRKNNPGTQQKYVLRIKAEVLGHYGPGGRAECSWKGCTVDDIDMLSLDHVDNDGAKDRKLRGSGGIRIYLRVKREGYPGGYQTLCHNHQWKKEILRRRKF